MTSRPHHLPIEVWMIVKDGAKLRRARRDAGLTQDQLAALCKVTQQYISALEKGIDDDCSERVAEAICKWVKIDRLEDYFDEHRAVRMPAITTSSRDAGNAA